MRTSLFKINSFVTGQRKYSPSRSIQFPFYYSFSYYKSYCRPFSEIMWPVGRKSGGFVSFISMLETRHVMDVYSRWAVGRFFPRTWIFGSQVGHRWGYSNFLSVYSRQNSDFNTVMPTWSNWYSCGSIGRP